VYKQSAYILVLAVAALVTIGLVMLYSTGAFAPDSHGDQFNFLKRQSVWLVVGFTFSIVFALVDYHWLQRSWYILFPAALMLLALCFVRPIGMRVNGSWRWIHVGSITFQASELAKLASIIFIAWWFSKFEAKCKGFLMGLLYPVAVIAILLTLIVLETDLGTTLLIGGVVFLMMFVAGASPKFLGPLVLAGFAALLIIAWHISERQGRLLAFLHPDQAQPLPAAHCLKSAHVKTRSVVPDRATQHELVSPRAHPDIACLCMLDRVGQGFLDDSIERYLG